MRRSHPVAFPVLVLSLLVLPACTGDVIPITPPQASAHANGQNAGSDFDDTDDIDSRQVAFSFVVLGCNRVDKADVNMATNPSTANVEQLRRTFSEIAQLSPRPKFVFFAGDMVYGYSPDTVTLAVQLQSWLGLWDTSPLATARGLTLVPIPGNHEVQNDKKIAFAAAERTWLRNMGPRLAFAGNGPLAHGADNLATNQDSLTYSFDYLGTHFVLLDTDPVGKDWSVPLNWVMADVANAHARGAQHIFAVGHKPAHAYPIALYNPPMAKPDGLGRVYPAERDALWASLNGAHAEAMLSAHDHLYWRTQGPSGRGTWQIVAGNGGSLFDPLVNQAPLDYFGFTVVKVLKNGRVALTSYGRNTPAAGYLASSAGYPTTVRDRADITFTP